MRRRSYTVQGYQYVFFLFYVVSHSESDEYSFIIKITLFECMVNELDKHFVVFRLKSLLQWRCFYQAPLSFFAFDTFLMSLAYLWSGFWLHSLTLSRLSCKWIHVAHNRLLTESTIFESHSLLVCISNSLLFVAYLCLYRVCSWHIRPLPTIWLSPFR